MYKLEQIQTTKITLDTIHLLNSYIYYKSRDLNSVGKPYEILEFYDKENTSTNNWKYKINSYGYRDSEWDFNKTVAFFGCSFTFGVGAEYAYPYLVQQRIGKITPNIGIPGGSVVNILKTFSAFSRIHPMSTAVISLPPIHRFYSPSLTNTGWISNNLLPNFHDSKTDRIIFKKWINNIDISYAADYIDWAVDISNQKKIKIFWTSWDQDTYKFLKEMNLQNIFKWPIIELNGRDGGHPGQSTHNRMADLCISLI